MPAEPSTILKSGRLAIIQNDDKYIVTEHAANGECIFSKPSANLMEAATLFADMFGLRVHRWALEKSKKEIICNTGEHSNE